MKVILSAQAVKDLRSIRSYVGEHSPKAADRLGRRLIETCESLAVFPDRGRPGSEPGTRESVVIWPYVIAYRVGQDEVQILHVRHGAQGEHGD